MWKKIFWGKKMPRRIVFAAGLYSICYPVYDMMHAPVVHKVMQRAPIDLSQNYGQNSYAIITGATSDTGRAYAEQLHKNNFKLILIDEDIDKVNKMAADFPSSKCYDFDWKTKTKWQDYSSLCEKIQNETQEPISVLVNNVEQFDKGKGKIEKTSDKDIMQCFNSNTFPLVFMTRFMGPHMKKSMQEQGKKAAIINMTSYYTEWPVYNAPIYCASKSLTDVLSQVVGYENQDMDILTVQGLPVKSKRNPNGVDPAELVEGVLADLGHERISYGHWTHSAMRYWILVRQCNFWFLQKSHQ